MSKVKIRIHWIQRPHTQEIKRIGVDMVVYQKMVDTPFTQIFPRDQPFYTTASQAESK